MYARPYPAHLLEGCETGLCLFAAAFLGHNDAIHFAEAGIKTFCVDTDGERLSKMATLYPDDWRWAVDDAWKFADDAYALGETWDAVSVDSFTGEALERSMQSIELWCSLARKLVTVTVSSLVPWRIPPGWNFELLQRSSGGIYWLVLTRA